MGRVKKYINIFGSFTEPFIYPSGQDDTIEMEWGGILGYESQASMCYILFPRLPRNNWRLNLSTFWVYFFSTLTLLFGGHP